MIFVWSLITKRSVLKVRLRKIASSLIILFSNPWLTHKAILALEERPVEIYKTYEVGIMLSGILESGINEPGQIHFGQGADRIIETIRLYKKGDIQKILISGGKSDINFPTENEGRNLVQLVRSLGVADSDIILENRSRNTFENAKYTAELLEDQTGNFLLITSAFHMKRSAACFKKQGVDFDIYPVDFRAANEFGWIQLIPQASALENWNLVIKELVGSMVYKLVGYT